MVVGLEAWSTALPPMVECPITGGVGVCRPRGLSTPRRHMTYDVTASLPPFYLMSESLSARTCGKWCGNNGGVSEGGGVGGYCNHSGIGFDGGTVCGFESKIGEVVRLVFNRSIIVELHPTRALLKVPISLTGLL